MSAFSRDDRGYWVGIVPPSDEHNEAENVRPRGDPILQRSNANHANGGGARPPSTRGTAAGPQRCGSQQTRSGENFAGSSASEASAGANANSSSYSFRFLFGEGDSNRPTASTGPRCQSSTSSGATTITPGSAAAAAAASTTTTTSTSVASLVGAIGDTTKLLQSDLSSMGIVVPDAAALECATRIVLHHHHHQRDDDDDDDDDHHHPNGSDTTYAGRM